MSEPGELPTSDWTDAELVAYARGRNTNRLPVYYIPLCNCVRSDGPDTVEVKFNGSHGIEVRRLRLAGPGVTKPEGLE